MVVSRLFSFLLRLGELAFSVVVLGINGWYLDTWRKSHQHIPGRFIYIEVAAALGTLFALLWLLPTLENVAFHWVGDFILSVLFFAAFGLLVNWFGAGACGGVFNWGGIAHNNDDCSRWKAVEAFTFLAAIFFLVSALLALFVSRGNKHTTHTTTHRRRGWYRSHRV